MEAKAIYFNDKGKLTYNQEIFMDKDLLQKTQGYAEQKGDLQDQQGQRSADHRYISLFE